MIALQYLALGAFFGLTAGISPGPLLALVITETLKHNRKEGIKIALAPLVTDLPIIAVTLLLLSRFSRYHVVLGIISILGGLFVAYLGFETVRSKGLKSDIRHTRPDSLKKGVIANFLSPHPYLFWLTVGTPLVLKAYRTGLLASILYIAGFYALFVFSKVGIALLVDRSRTFVNSKAYVWVMRMLGVILFVFAIMFLTEGIRMILKNWRPA